MHQVVWLYHLGTWGTLRKDQIGDEEMESVLYLLTSGAQSHSLMLFSSRTVSGIVGTHQIFVVIHSSIMLCFSLFSLSFFEMKDFMKNGKEDINNKW